MKVLLSLIAVTGEEWRGVATFGNGDKDVYSSSSVKEKWPYTAKKNVAHPNIKSTP